jgi:hypothetical protein
MRISWLVVSVVLCLACSCTPPNNPTNNPSPQPSGEALARSYCASCHAFPEPELLDRPRWNTVLPFMGGRLGIYATHARDSLIALTLGDGVNADSLYPTTPALAPEEWEAIVAYYRLEAPDSLVAQPRPPLTIGLPGFEIRETGNRFRPPLTTLTQIQEDLNLFLVGNHAQENTLIVIKGVDELLFTWELEGAPIATHWDQGRLFILLIGQSMAPTDLADGSLQVVDGPDAPVRPLITGLKRPVDMDFGDLNGDGRQDVVICEFGNHTGFLSWYEDTGNGTYRRHVLSNQPGAASAEIVDLNGDGLLDIGVLMAQGDEGIDFYINEGGGRFTAKRVLRFPPVYGSNHVEFVDFNADGILDMLYANGDNGDITPILKSYHGVRIFLGNADGSFEERFFFPMHGAVSAKAADFDQDGDLDIAAISYFPDYAHTPEESFVLLQNNGDLTFEAYTFEDSDRGRWLRMDVGDLDGDGDPDILLGSNISFGPQGDETDLFKRWVQEAPSVLILENR